MPNEFPSRSPLRSRYLLDSASAERWTVEEREFHDQRALFFNRDGGFVRQRTYPDNWAELSDPDLLALLPTRGDAASTPAPTKPIPVVPRPA